MAVTDSYSTAAAYRSFITKTDTGKDTDILTDLTTISRYLDRELGRFFTKDAAAVARTYVADADWTTLYTADIVSVTSIKLDDNGDGTAETALAATDYTLIPRNAVAGSEARPYTGIEMSRTGTRAAFAAGQVVEVTAVWGWPAVPGPIARATVELTAILRLETPRAQATISEIGQLVTMSAKARNIVWDLAQIYRRYSP